MEIKEKWKKVGEGRRGEEREGKGRRRMWRIIRSDREDK